MFKNFYYAFSLTSFLVSLSIFVDIRKLLKREKELEAKIEQQKKHP